MELHLHTKMSDLDGVSDIKDIIRQAMSWGHNAIAITDHGDVQAFTDAYHMLRDSGNKDFKVIYGVEAYIVDDLRKIILIPRVRNLMIHMWYSIWKQQVFHLLMTVS